MKFLKFHACVSFLAIGMLLSACPPKPVDVGVAEPPKPEPVLPPGHQKVPPAPLDTSDQMLAQTATIFTGVLKDVKFTFDDCAGPRTHYVFSDSTNLLGTQLDPNVTLKVLGGPLPSGNWVRVSELPELALDSQYVVFLRNTDWTFSPVVGNLIFRRETVNGRELLVDPTGHAVTGWGDNGPVLSVARVSEPIGRQLRGFRSSEPRPQTDHSTSGEPDPQAQVTPANPGTTDQSQVRTESSTLARAPSLDEVRKAGMFSKPAISDADLREESPLSAESLVAAVRTAADRAHVSIGGAMRFDPYWRCWSYVRTARASR